MTRTRIGANPRINFPIHSPKHGHTLFSEALPHPSQHHNWKNACTEQMQTFFQILDDIAFPVIAMRGIAPVYTYLNDDLRRELYLRSQTVVSDETMKTWLKIYANIRRPDLLDYESTIRKERYLEEEHD